MLQSEYEILVRRTLPRIDTVQDFVHMVLGIETELIEYNNAFSKSNRYEELADVLWYVYNLAYILDMKMPDFYDSTVMDDLSDQTGIRLANKASDELLDIAKKYLAYNKTPDRTKVYSLLVSIQYSINREVFWSKIEIEVAFDAVIAKLRKRFPDKFDPEMAINRNVVAENKIIDDTVAGSPV